MNQPQRKNETPVVSICGSDEYAALMPDHGDVICRRIAASAESASLPQSFPILSGTLGSAQLTKAQDSQNAPYDEKAVAPKVLLRASQARQKRWLLNKVQNERRTRLRTPTLRCGECRQVSEQALSERKEGQLHRCEFGPKKGTHSQRAAARDHRTTEPALRVAILVTISVCLVMVRRLTGPTTTLATETSRARTVVGKKPRPDQRSPLDVGA